MIRPRRIVPLLFIVPLAGAVHSRFRLVAGSAATARRAKSFK